MQIPEARISLRKIGREGEPLVIIDDFSGIADELLNEGRNAKYQNAGASSYPGLRSWADPSYLDRRRALMMQVMQRVFGFTRGVRLDASTFSIVTMREDELTPRQRIPHYDHASGEIVAVMHYLNGSKSGGTAFYRHRRTSFETVTPEREQAYNAALMQDEREYGIPTAHYCHGNSDRFEMIDEVEAKRDRLVLYRGRQLHSGVIPDPAALSVDPREGRLTINMFIQGL
jgi:hypothetical protein